MAVRLSEIGVKISKVRQWPTLWKGGRIVDIYKRKGLQEDCDNSRGILLACHLFKILFSIVMRSVTVIYNAMMPATQCGA
eukprot:3509903-Karenia_brevis.AAC.1